MAAQIRDLRLQLQAGTSPDNLKRGEGGTIDVEHVAQMLTLRHAGKNQSIIRQGTTASLDALAEAGFLSREDADTLTAGYQSLRRTEASLRLMNSPARHSLPRGDEAMRNLAFLMGERDGQTIVQKCDEARRANRKIFDRIFDDAAS
jgi:glutamate-ammonia-ligase adenylyltransferase